MRRRWIGFGLVCSVLAVWCRSGAAQVVDVQTFQVADHTFWIDVAAADNGIYFVREASDGSEVTVQRAFLDAPSDAPVPVSVGGPATLPTIAASPAGGFTVAWIQQNEVFTRFLDVLGVPTGTPFQLSDDHQFLTGRPRAGALGAGGVVVWGESIAGGGPHLRAQVATHRYDLAGGPLEWEIATTAMGGCVIAWHYFDGANGGVQARLFDADGSSLTAPLPLAGDDFTLGDVAASPAGDVMAVVGVRPTTATNVYEIRALRFDASGTTLGPEIVVATAHAVPFQGTYAILPKAEFDFAGNLYVVWGDDDGGIRARAYTPNGAPFGPDTQVSPQKPPAGVHTTRLPDGRFVNAWVSGQFAWANVVAFTCVPGEAVCGDGIVNPKCERCDDGAGNDDALPDACRTTCLPAHCGDGVVDTGETCDDGNFDVCDGCDSSCQLEPGFVCGDGVASPACGEQCDDGNSELLDGCTPSCMLERIPGGGAGATDCLAEWAVDNRANVPAYDKRGAINWKQRCVDDDPRCDFDGGTPGSCTFHVRVCGNGTNVLGCAAPLRLSSWTLERPSEKQVAKRPELAAVRDALRGAVPAAIVGASVRDVCSDVVAITLPLRSGAKAAKMKLQTTATSYDGRLDRDKLGLECLPGQ